VTGSEGYYEAVHARPDGESTVSRLALTAAECGYDGLVVRNHGDAAADYDPDAGDAHGVDVVDGVEVRADDRSSAAGFLASHRDRRTLVCVHGGEEGMDRFAVDSERVDVLAHPGRVNHVLVRRAAEHGVRLEANLAAVLRTTGGERVRAVRRLRRLRDLVEKYDAAHVVSADARSHLGLHGPRELVAAGEAVGLDGAFVREGLCEWGRLAARNRERASEAFIEPGVRRGRHEEDR
jgi:ribonuclease P/MRP protein subunit RPP1